MLQLQVMPQLVHESTGLLLHRADIGIRESVTIHISRPDVPTSQRDLEIVAGQLAAAGAGAVAPGAGERDAKMESGGDV